MKTQIKKYFSPLNALLRDEKGATFVVVGLSMMALIGASGAALDIGRAQMVQAKLSSSIDAAGLAAGSTVSTTNLNTEVNKYLKANFQNYLGAQIKNLSVAVNADSTIITISATASVPMSIMQVFGHESINVSASTEITRASSGLELVMVLDNTGSMSGSKLTSLKSAATQLVNNLFGSSNSVEDLWIGLVPFAQAVNIGNSRGNWTSNTAFNWGTTSWMGCVDARETGNRDTTDEPPSQTNVATLFPKYYWPCDNNNKWYGTNGNRDNCATNGTILYKTLNTSTGPNKQCSQAVTPLTANKTTILNGINAMAATGNTHVGLGAVWGWRMLSPRWRTLWGGEMNANQLPLDYNTPKMNKAAIIMTDGDNTIDNTSHTAYWYLSDGKLGTTNSSAALTQLNNRLTSVCNSMKNNNITVYTIGFGTLSSTAKTLLKNCASQADYFFSSPTSADLDIAFRQIGDSLSNLRVSR